MEIQYYGSNCVKITTKKSHIVIDPKSEIATISPDIKKATQILVTQTAYAPEKTDVFIADSPGEYEFEDCSIKGIATQAFQGASGDKSATMYRVSSADVTVLITGNINEKLTEDQLESIGLVDVVVVPVGGNGYSLDATGAATVVRAIEPKLVIPVFYEEDKVRYEVPPASLELFTKELGAPVEEPTDKYKAKQLPERTTVQPLSVS